MPAWLFTLLAVVLLGGCASGKPDRVTATGSPAAGASAARSGGYYLDDGPGNLSREIALAVPDAVPRPEPVLARTARPYTVFGRTYVPMTALAPYRERGIASWYGRRYHGRPTSSGEPYDMVAMTAAHPTLPIPSYARVTRVDTGQSIIVRINDRGPFLHGRVIDLSWSGAVRLGFIDRGSAEVVVETITAFGSSPMITAQSTNATAPERATQALPRPDPPAAGDATQQGIQAGVDRFWLQLGAWTSQQAALGALERIREELPWLQDRVMLHSEGGLYKVQAGPWPTRDPAFAALQRASRDAGLEAFVVLRDSAPALADRREAMPAD